MHDILIGPPVHFTVREVINATHIQCDALRWGSSAKLWGALHLTPNALPCRSFLKKCGAGLSNENRVQTRIYNSMSGPQISVTFTSEASHNPIYKQASTADAQLYGGGLLMSCIYWGYIF
jgi:hypothetical protein